jgi:tRNA threonylcarbamoyladenosine biosynthesis protein TsaB
LLPAKRRPPERTWWGQFIAAGRGEGSPFEAGEAELMSLASGVQAVCGGLSEVPDLRISRIIALPSARAAADFVYRLPGQDLPSSRPIYVRAPDAKPMNHS